VNLFKVFASGKKGFQEEYASVIMAWLLNPRMEHGLGYVFLNEFILQLAEGFECDCKNGDGAEGLRKLAAQLKATLRSDSCVKPEVDSYIEYNVDNSFIDVVVAVNDYVFAIENKVRSSSAQNIHQLQLQYEGIQGNDISIGKNICMVFLVPYNGNGFDRKINVEYEKLQIDYLKRRNDGRVLLAWQEINSGPSVSRMLANILKAEREGGIDPLPEYTRHTLKALRRFIAESFSGYEFEREKSSYGPMNPLTEDRYDAAKLEGMNAGYVGVAYGMSGLLRMLMGHGLNKDFQYSLSSELVKNKNWLPIERFNALARWGGAPAVKGSILEYILPSDGRLMLQSDIINWLSKVISGDDAFFVGIQGGEKAFNSMSEETIRRSKWQIARPDADGVEGNSNWFPKQRFMEIYSDRIKTKSDD